METKWDDLSFEAVRSRAADFSREREWDQFHTPRNLLCALVGEVGELSECFQWKGEVKQSLEGFSDAEKVHVGEEIADVLVYLVRLADKAGIDLPSAVSRKMDLNAVKYPVHLAKGRSDKYTTFTDSRVEAANSRESGPSGDADQDQVAEQVETGPAGVSELGTPEYWETFYDREYNQLEMIAEGERIDDHFEDWFSEHTGKGRLSTFITGQAAERLGSDQKIFIDVGCGNGAFLLDNNLLKSFDVLVGIDYVPAATTMASALLDRKIGSPDVPAPFPKVEFLKMDILDEQTPEHLNARFETYCQDFHHEIPWHVVVHDKGTLDAIYLARGQRLTELGDYVEHVHRLFDLTTGLFIITSCNLTESELLEVFDERFSLQCQLPHKTFKFGGKTGNALVTMCFLCLASQT